MAQAPRLMENAFMEINAELHAWSTRQHANVVTKFILGNPNDTGRIECKSILEMYGKWWKNQEGPKAVTNPMILALKPLLDILMLIVLIFPILERSGSFYIKISNLILSGKVSKFIAANLLTWTNFPFFSRKKYSSYTISLTKD